MLRILSIMACAAVVAIGALALGASPASASERYWRHHGGFIHYRDTFCGPGGGTDCPVTRDYYGHRGHYRHRDHYRRYSHLPRYHHIPRYHRGGGFSIYLGLPVDPYYEPRYVPRYVPRRHHRVIGHGDAHVRWCHARYRSYRAWDNTFQPYHGPRLQCRSPYR